MPKVILINEKKANDSAVVNDFSIRKRFVPARIVHHYHEQATSSASSTTGNVGLADFLTSMEVQPWVESYSAAVLFADISGFSRLAEDLEKDLNCSVNAAEKLYLYIETSMSQMVKIVYKHGGDIVKFAGDACMAVFDKKYFQDSLPKASLSACKSALELAGLNFKANGIMIRIHCGVAAGNIVGYQVGGVMNRYEYIVTGEPIREMCVAANEAKAGQVVLAQSAYKNLWEAIPKKLRAEEDLQPSVELKPSDLKSPKQGLLPVEVFYLESRNYILFRLSMRTCYFSAEILQPASEDDISNLLIPILESYIPLPALLAIKSKSCDRIAGFKALNQISMGSFSIERANRTTPIDVSALKPHLELLLESHTSSDGSLESLVVLGIFSCLHGWYDLAIQACTLSFDHVQCNFLRTGPLNWYYPIAQTISIYCAIQHFHHIFSRRSSIISL